MILDALDLPAGSALTASVCIVGAGPAGITAALELIERGIDVLLLESGGSGFEAETQALYAGSVADAHLHSPPDRYRQRQFGGASATWGGRCVPFDDIDFEQRDYIPFSGWPFGRDELLPYYVRAIKLCEAGEFAFAAEDAFDRPLRPMIRNFESPHFTTNSLERFSCPTNFALRYAHKLRRAPRARVVLHANVTRLQLDPAGRAVTELSAATLSGKTFSIRANHFVLATGGLEVARLLLANSDVQPNGIGNDHDVVGRYYMCHIAGTTGTLQFRGDLDVVYHDYDISNEGIYCRRRFALSSAAQRRFALANFVARLHHPRITDPAHRTGVLSALYLAKAFIPYEYGKRLHGEEKATLARWLQHVWNVTLAPWATAAFMVHLLRDRRFAERKFPTIVVHPRVSRYSLDFHVEQQPNPLSRVSLSEERDALGMPRIHVDWRYCGGDVDMVKRTVALLASDIRKSGVGQFDYEPEALEAEMIRYGAYGGHHIGTARMGDNPRYSVVNSHCRVHSVGNLYIAGSAVFPTSSQANPTLTIVAMALRLARHLEACQLAHNAGHMVTLPIQEVAACAS